MKKRSLIIGGADRFSRLVGRRLCGREIVEQRKAAVWAGEWLGLHWRE